MSNTNSIHPYSKARLEDLQEAIGITQFPGEFTWFQVIGGLIIQGGYESFTSASVRTVNFPAPFSMQVLGVFISPESASNGPHGNMTLVRNLNSFQINHHGPNANYFWWAIGV